MIHRPEFLVKVLIHEAFHHRKVVIGLFIVINLATLTLSLIWPNVYTSSTTVLVEDKKIIQPLMQGAAVATEVTDRARLAREIIFGRRFMNQILKLGGWADNGITPSEEAKMIEKISKRTTLSTVGRDIIRIEYRDENPERALKVTEKYAELFIAESLGTKAQESQAAYEFIDKQAQEYHEKLINAEQQLKEFRTANLDAQPGAGADLAARLGNMLARIEQTNQDLKELEIRKISLEKQLSGEAEVVAAVSREGQYRARAAELQSQLDTLRLSYHDTYPDIIRIKNQIEELSAAIAAERQNRQVTKASGGSTVVDDSVANNPLYQQLRRELYQTQVNIDTLTARLNEAKRQLSRESERGQRMHVGEATLAEFTRDYQVNRDIYQDLLRRRENARVSMNLDKERQGLSIKIQEPATLPLHPSGVRFMHFILGGIIFGVMTPLGLLYTKVRFDPRIRIGHIISDTQKLPLIATVPHLWSPAETQAARRETTYLSLALTVALLAVVSVAVLRFVKVF